MLGQRTDHLAEWLAESQKDLAELKRLRGQAVANLMRAKHALVHETATIESLDKRIESYTTLIADFLQERNERQEAEKAAQGPSRGWFGRGSARREVPHAEARGQELARAPASSGGESAQGFGAAQGVPAG